MGTIRITDFLVFDQSGIRMKKTNDAGTVRYWNKATQSGIILVQCRTETLDAGMPRPALVIDADAQ
jgi:hypothetical protein